MTIDNLILIKGGAYNDIKKALKQWINLYSNDLQDGLTFQLYKNGRGNHIIQADNQLDNEKFFYLVNYLNYPEGIKYKIDIEGFTTGKEENKLKGHNLLVYISSTDKDNVFVTTSANKNYKVNFNGKILETKERKVFRQPIDLLFENPEILNVNKKELEQDEEHESVFSIGKRFKTLLIITVSLFIATHFILLISQNQELFHKSTFFLGMGIWVWFFADYRMLRINKYYLRCLGISILFAVYGILLHNKYENNDSIALSPLILLILQRPIRHLFIKLFKREPNVNNSENLIDFIYILILFLGSIISPMLAMVSIK